MSIPISTGSGAASVAAEAVSGLQYQQIEILGKGGGSTLGVNPDGSLNASIIGVPTFTAGGGSILSVPTGSVITVWKDSSVIAIATGSIISVPSGSVLTIPTSSTITVWKDSSIVSIPVGSTVAVLQGASIVGTYAEDAGHTTGDKGFFILGVRNDTLASISSADADYTPLVVGPSGETIAVDAPLTKWIQGTADFRGNAGASVAVIAAQGASIFTYIREVQLANMGSASVLVTFGGATDSIIGYSIAPAGGGSNFITRLKTSQNAAFSASISGVASVLMSAQGFISKA